MLAISSILDAQEVPVIDRKGTINTINNNLVTTSLTAPIDPVEGDFWIQIPTMLSRIYDGNLWQIIDPDRVTISDIAAPINPQNGDLWISQDDNVVLTRAYNNGTWDTISDNLGKHIASRNLDLDTNRLVGGAGSLGLSISSLGYLTIDTLEIGSLPEDKVVVVDSTGKLKKVDFSASQITDEDGDTKIQVEETDDEDVIRFDTEGQEKMAILANGRVGIGTSAPDSSAILEVSDTTRGVLLPRMTTEQRDAIVNPAQALLTFNTSDTAFNFFFEDSWYAVLSEEIEENFILDRNYNVGNDHKFIYRSIELSNGTVWLTHNLGANYANENHPAFNPEQEPTSRLDPDAFGSYYQWGRFSDGHEFLTSTVTTTTSSTDTPSNSNFIRNNTVPRDWRIPQNENLWQGEAGINNPCPEGFRVPTQTEFEDAVALLSISNHNDAFDSVLKFTTNGNRRGASGIFADATLGSYWTSTVVSGSEHSRFFRLSSSGASISLIDRTYGDAVRCIQD